MTALFTYLCTFYYLSKADNFLFKWISFLRINPLGPRPAAALSLRNPLRREVTVSNDTTLKINNKHQTKISAHFVFFQVCQYSVLVYPTGFDFFFPLKNKSIKKRNPKSEMSASECQVFGGLQGFIDFAKCSVESPKMKLQLRYQSTKTMQF